VFYYLGIITMLKKVLFGAFVATLLSACQSGGYSPTGLGPMTDIRGPIAATSVVATKRGKACAKTLLGGLINEGDASIVTAKENGGISAVSTVDFHTKGFYPFMGTTCTIVTGR
jgi:hypothetical protein